MKVIDLLNKMAKGEEVHFKTTINRKNVEADFYNFNDFNTSQSMPTINFADIIKSLNDEVEIIEEDEFEDIESFGIHYSWDYIDYKNIEELKKYLNKDFQNIFDILDKLIKNQKLLRDKVEYLNNKIKNKEKWCQLIADLGYDYDGYRDSKNLMLLIDELVKYALYSRDDYNFDDFLRKKHNNNTFTY